jgi:hypothetical protein
MLSDSCATRWQTLLVSQASPKLLRYSKYNVRRRMVFFSCFIQRPGITEPKTLAKSIILLLYQPFIMHPLSLQQ